MYLYTININFHGEYLQYISGEWIRVVIQLICPAGCVESALARASCVDVQELLLT